MGLAKQTTHKDQQANLMASPDIKYVSLVQHAANREPFRVVKNDITGGGTNMAGAKIQRIIAPEGSNVLAILASEGIEFDGAVSVETKNTTEGFDIYIQTGVEKFDPKSFALRKLTSKSDKAVMALVGNLKSEFKSDSSVVSLKSDLQSPLDTTVVNVEVDQGYYGMYVTTTTAAEALDTEAWNLYRGIGILGSAVGMDSKTRLKTMLALVDGFRTFVGTLLVFVEENNTETKADTAAEAVFKMPIFEKLQAVMAAKNEDEFMALTAEDLANITKSVVTAFQEIKTMEQKAEEDKTTQQQLEVAAAEKNDLSTKIKDLEAQVAGLTTAKSDLEAKLAELDVTPAADTTSTGATKADPEKSVTPVIIRNFKTDFSSFNRLFSGSGK